MEISDDLLLRSLKAFALVILSIESLMQVRYEVNITSHNYTAAILIVFLVFCILCFLRAFPLCINFLLRIFCLVLIAQDDIVAVLILLELFFDFLDLLLFSELSAFLEFVGDEEIFEWIGLLFLQVLIDLFHLFVSRDADFDLGELSCSLLQKNNNEILGLLPLDI